ncbi:tyrosine-type recombinase/integrase [Sulfurovum sp. CS9]|uniref:tyrosine-type recombinase/integrase n=1 Tax=Sulfurovum sp. CS9 TaxID=3391146 RepID=UPI0039E88F9B
MAKIKRYLSVLKVLLPNDLSKLNMSLLDSIRGKLTRLPKMNIQKYRVKSITELLKLHIPTEDKQSAETVNGYIKLLNALLKFAYEREAVSRQFTVTLAKRSGSSRDERQALNIEEIKKLMHDSGNQKLIPLYKILYYSGMRLSEVYKCKLTVVDGIKCFDLTDGTSELKTKSSYRLIPVHDSLDDAELLLEQARAVRDGYATRKTSEFFKTKGKSLYSLRHSFATQLASEGIETTIISELLGHAHNGMTLERYVKGYPTKLLSESINKLDAI